MEYIHSLTALVLKFIIRIDLFILFFKIVFNLKNQNICYSWKDIQSKSNYIFFNLILKNWDNGGAIKRFQNSLEPGLKWWNRTYASGFIYSGICIKSTLPDRKKLVHIKLDLTFNIAKM